MKLTHMKTFSWAQKDVPFPSNWQESRTKLITEVRNCLIKFLGNFDSRWTYVKFCMLSGGRTLDNCFLICWMRSRNCEDEGEDHSRNTAIILSPREHPASFSVNLIKSHHVYVDCIEQEVTAEGDTEWRWIAYTRNTNTHQELCQFPFPRVISAWGAFFPPVPHQRKSISSFAATSRAHPSFLGTFSPIHASPDA